jgi:uncharacterized MnhB-related membrane protein
VNLTNEILMILVNRDLFNYFDELERKTYLKSITITLGLSMVVGLTFSLLDQQDLILFDAEIGYLVMIMRSCYWIAMRITIKRYK